MRQELNAAMILQGHVNALCMVRNFLASPGARSLTLDQILAEVEEDLRRARVQEQAAYKSLIQIMEHETEGWKEFLR